MCLYAFACTCAWVSKMNSGVFEGTTHLGTEADEPLTGDVILSDLWLVPGNDERGWVHLRLIMLWLFAVESRPRENVPMEISESWVWIEPCRSQCNRDSQWGPGSVAHQWGTGPELCHCVFCAIKHLLPHFCKPGVGLEGWTSSKSKSTWTLWTVIGPFSNLSEGNDGGVWDSHLADKVLWR